MYECVNFFSSNFHFTFSFPFIKGNKHIFQSNDWQEVTIYEITSWHFKEDLPAETNPILELVKFIMQGPKIDPENKMVVLSRLTSHFIDRLT